MRNVRVGWTGTVRKDPPGSKAHHHYRVGLELQEQTVPVGTMEALFINIEAGLKTGYVVPCAEDGTELAPLKAFSVEVVDVPDVEVMVPLDVTTTLL